MSLDTSVELREDMYSLKFTYKFKRGVLYGDNKEELSRTRRFGSDYKSEGAKSNWYNDFSAHRKSMTGKWRFMVITQLLLVWFLGYESVTSDDTVEAFKTPPADG